MTTSRILIVDDEPDVAELVKQQFRREIKDGSCQFSFAHDGVEALDILNAEADIEIVFSDINMPRMDGLRLLSELQTRERPPTTVIVSAYGDQKNIRTAMNNGAFDFITKPIEFDDFRATMEKAIKHNNHLSELMEDRLQAERNESQLRRYFSPSVARAVAEDTKVLSDQTGRREATFLFTDLTSFSSLVESTPSATVVDLLNNYFDGLVKVIFDHNGTLMKVIGDAVHVMFGAPQTDEHHARSAIQCALAIDDFAMKFMADQNAKGVPLGTTRIGINSGKAIIGNIGGELFFDYTAYGVAVNMAARLESANKVLGTRICVSKSTVDCWSGFVGRPSGLLDLRGSTKPIMAFEPLTSECASTEQISLYVDAFYMLEQSKAEAKQAFANLVSQNPDDPLAALHLSRILSGANDVNVKA